MEYTDDEMEYDDVPVSAEDDSDEACPASSSDLPGSARYLCFGTH